MVTEIITKRLIKIASSLDTKSLHKKAEWIRKICADIAKFLPVYESENDQRIKLEKDIKGIAGVASVRSNLKPVHDAIYYDITFKNGLKASLNQTLFGPLRTVSKVTEKRPYVLKMVDTTGKTMPGGKELNEKELLDMIKKIGEGSSKEIEMLSKEMTFSE
jgi:hypothetical protein